MSKMGTKPNKIQHLGNVLTDCILIGKYLILLILERAFEDMKSRREEMVSNTKITEARRARKIKNGGSKRKTANRNKGTTPKFAIHEKPVKSEKK